MFVYIYPINNSKQFAYFFCVDIMFSMQDFVEVEQYMLRLDVDHVVYAYGSFAKLGL